jgi:hypothetical protein
MLLLPTDEDDAPLIMGTGSSLTLPFASVPRRKLVGSMMTEGGVDGGRSMTCFIVPPPPFLPAEVWAGRAPAIDLGPPLPIAAVLSTGSGGRWSIERSCLGAGREAPTFLVGAAAELGLE